jgi:hypothetical protein
VGGGFTVIAASADAAERARLAIATAARINTVLIRVCVFMI